MTSFLDLFKSPPPIFMVMHHDFLQAAQVEYNDGRFNLIGFNHVPLEEGIIENGDIVGSSAFEQALAQLFLEARPNPIQSKKMILNIPYSLVYPFVMDFQHRLSEKVMKSQLMDFIHDHSPMLAADLSLNFTMREYGHKVSYGAVGTPKNWTKKINQLVKSIGIKSVQYVSEPVSQLGISKEWIGGDFALFSRHRGQVYLSLFRQGLLYDSFFLNPDHLHEESFDCLPCMNESQKAYQSFKQYFGEPIKKSVFAGFKKDDLASMSHQSLGDIVLLDPEDLAGIYRLFGQTKVSSTLMGLIRRYFVFSAL